VYNKSKYCVKLLMTKREQKNKRYFVPE